MEANGIEVPTVRCIQVVQTAGARLLQLVWIHLLGADSSDRQMQVLCLDRKRPAPMSQEGR